MDKKYWMEYYQKDLAPHTPSKFAIDIIDNLDKGKELLELGCGNGRDSIFFKHNGLQVTAIDQAENVIEQLNKNFPAINFTVDDFVNSDIMKNKKFDYIYSRFTMHSITAMEQDTVLKQVFHALREGGFFFIEVRSTKDNIFGLGQCVGPNEYIYDDHYRRFIDKREIDKYLTNLGFKLIISEEGTGFAPFNNEDPIVLRIIAHKD